VEDYSVVLRGSNVGLNEALSKGDFSAYPNPFGQSLELVWDPSQASKPLIKVSNSKGQIVFEKLMESNSGRFSIDSQSWPKGLYLIEFSNSLSSSSQVCIKQ